MTKDRDYYRALTNRELIDETKNAIRPDWQELAIVLAERLEDMLRVNDWEHCPHCGSALT